MKKINVFINGFGRIGRALMRKLLEDERFEIVGLNDLFSFDQFAYLLQFDSTYGRLPYRVEQEGQSIKVRGMTIPLFNAEDAQANIYDGLDIDILFQCTGKHLTSIANQPFLDRGIKKIIVSAPPIDDLPIFIPGINDEIYQGEKIVSAGSCSANAIVPILQLLDENAGIEAASVTMIHSYTREQKLLDTLVNADEKLRSRSATTNILPFSSSAVSTVEKLLPQIRDHLQAHSIRVPVSAGTAYDFTVRVNIEISANEIKKLMIDASRTKYRKLMIATTSTLASTDIIGDPHGITIESERTYSINDKFIKLFGWQDNEVGYVSQMIRTAFKVISKDVDCVG